MTISIRLDPRLEAALRRRLHERDIPLSVFVRDAISEKLEREEKEANHYRIGEPLFGRYSSGESNRSERRKEIVRAREVRRPAG